MRSATKSEDTFGRTPYSYDNKFVIREQLSIAGGSSSKSYMSLLNAADGVSSKTKLSYSAYTPRPASYVVVSSIYITYLFERFMNLFYQIMHV